MKKILVSLLAVPLMFFFVAGCSEGGGKSEAQKKFEGLYKEYSSRFYEGMANEPENIPPAQITAEAARIWDEVFGPQKALVTQRVEEILKDLDAAPPITQSTEKTEGKDVTIYTVGGVQYLELFSGTRNEPPPDQPKGVILKQFWWNPIGAAQWDLNNVLASVMKPVSFQLRQVLSINANPVWEALDRNVEHPKLFLKQGPLAFIVNLMHKEDYYVVDKMQVLRPKTMGPLVVEQTAPTGTGAPAAATGAAAPPAAKTPAPAPKTGTAPKG